MTAFVYIYNVSNIKHFDLFILWQQGANNMTFEFTKRLSLPQNWSIVFEPVYK